MRALLWLLGLFALAVSLVIAARYNEAYALIAWPPYRVQISMNLLVLLLLAGFALAYFLVRVGVRTFELPREVADFRSRRREALAARALNEAERLYLEGRFGQACKQAEVAYQGVSRPGIAALLAARAAHAMRDVERRTHWLERASQYDSETRMARLMLEAEMALADRDFDGAAVHVEALNAGGHRHLAVLRLAMQTEQGRGRWSEVARLARLLRKHRALTPEQVAPLLRRALLEQLRDAAGDMTALARVWYQIPVIEREDSGFLIRAVPYLIEAGDEKLAVQAIESALDKEWDTDLATLYGLCHSEDLRAQLIVGERWLSAHPSDAKLLLSLGRLCLRGQLWGKAQSYFEAALSLAPSRAAHLELARLAEKLERNEDSGKHFRAAASLDM